MKYTIKQSGINLVFICLILGLSVLSCRNDDFLKGSNDTYIQSAIYVSPDWEPESYPVSFPKAGNAKFTIKSAPGWLNIDNGKGQFVNGVAQIHCSAIRQDEFSNIGVYNGTMILNVEGVGTCLLPVCYVNEGNPVAQYSPESLNFRSPEEQASIYISNRGEGVLMWIIVEYPEWLVVDKTAEIAGVNSITSVNVRCNPDMPISEDVSGQIVIVTNSDNNPIFTIDINYIAPSSSFSCYPYDIDFGRIEKEKFMEIGNQGDGILTWSIQQCPNWLIFSKKDGTVASFNWDYITMWCNRKGLTPGEHTGTVVFKTNDRNNPTFTINVKFRGGSGDAANMIHIDGTITDVECDKATGILYMVTQNPNKLLAFDMNSKSFSRQISFANPPNCVSISEDHTRAIVGQNGFVTYIDLSNGSIIASYNLGINISDAALVGQICLLGTQLYPVWLDVETGAVTQFSGYQLYEKVQMKKIPGQNTILATRNGISPSGIFLIDPQTKETKKYFHDSIDPFWLTEDGGKIFTGWAHAYAMPTTSTVNISQLGNLPYSDGFFNNWLKWLDHCNQTNSLWVLAKSYYMDDFVLARYHATNYTLTRVYDYADDYTTVNGITDVYATSARYVFANSNGSEIFVIKNIAGVYGADAWSLEWIVPE